MNTFQPTISNLIPNHFPQIYKENGPQFIAFVQAYYEWLEQTYSDINIEITNASSLFVKGESVYQTKNGSNTATGTVQLVGNTSLTVNSVSGAYSTSLAIYGASSNTVANVAYVSNTITTGNPTYILRNMMSYLDIDSTLDQFIVYFQNTYLKGIQFDISSDKRLTVKRILDLYRAKGNSRAIKLLFQLVFGEDIDIYYPGKDIFKTSDGEYVLPVYLEVSSSSRTNEFLGKQFTGVQSGAVAFCDRIVRLSVGSKLCDVFFISKINSIDFITGEQLNINGNLVNVPTVTGSLTNLIVNDGGTGFSNGDIVNLTSTYGTGGTARVSNTSQVTGIVSFTLADGGWGFTTNSNVLISTSKVYLANINTTLPTNWRPIDKFSNVTFQVPGNNASNVYSNAFALDTTLTLLCGASNGTFVSGETIVSFDGNCSGTLKTISSNSSSTVLSVGNVVNSYFGVGNTVIGQTSGATATVSSFGATIGVMSMSGGVNSQYTSMLTSYPGTILTSSQTASFYNGELLYQSNGSANIATGIIWSQNTTAIQYSPLSGNFTTSYQVKGNVSGSNGVVSSVLPTQQVNATITSFSTGTTANVIISNTFVTETFYQYTDKISGNNSSNFPYMAMNLANTAFGFPSNPTANATSGLLIDIIKYNTLSLGEIQTIQTTNPGKTYNDNPFVEFYQNGIAQNQQQDYIITTQNVVGGFTVGEIVTQAVPLTGVISLTLTGVSGTYLVGENIRVAGANVGVVYNYSSNTLFVQNTAAISTSQVVTGKSSSASGTVSVIALSTTGTAYGRVKIISGANVNVKRMSSLISFVSGTNIVGQQSGAVANAYNVATDTNTLFSGDNANVISKVVTGNGTVTSLTVKNSGIGFVNGELITFSSADGSKTGTAKTILGKQGYGQGYYASTKGFLSADKYLQDGSFYQNYSYQILASVDLSKYADMVKASVHPAGTKMFGYTHKKFLFSNPLAVSNFSIATS